MTIGCPFNIPRLHKADSRVYKCTLCSDRVAVGLEPACIKACPTQALSFGSKQDMLDLARHRLEDLHERGFARAAVYDPAYQDPTPHGDDRLDHWRPVPRRRSVAAGRQRGPGRC